MIIFLNIVKNIIFYLVNQSRLELKIIVSVNFTLTKYYYFLALTYSQQAMINDNIRSFYQILGFYSSRRTS